jgi:hypothetical protein
MHDASFPRCPAKALQSPATRISTERFNSIQRHSNDLTWRYLVGEAFKTFPQCGTDYTTRASNSGKNRSANYPEQI